MQLTDPNLQQALDIQQRRSDPADWAGAHNIAFEERVGGQRQTVYEAYLSATDLIYYHNRYVEEIVRISNGLGVTFSADNATARVARPASDLELIRIETVEDAIKEYYRLSGQDGCDQINADIQNVQAGGTTAVRAQANLRDFLDQLQGSRDYRPVFAAPLDDVRAIADRDAWAEALAFHVGIDFPPSRAHGNKPILLQIRYTVADILAEAEQPESHYFSAPTAIDSPWAKDFFPSPDATNSGNELWGRILDVDNTMNTTTSPCRELLHPPFRFKPHHLTSARCFDPSVRPAAEGEPRNVRNAHLARVRHTTGRHDFGRRC